jgi:hypothetical protein
MELFAAGVQADTQSVKGAEHKPKLGTCMTMFDLDHPLTADANAFGQARLV